jgi:hypothetical protein
MDKDAAALIVGALFAIAYLVLNIHGQLARIIRLLERAVDRQGRE